MPDGPVHAVNMSFGFPEYHPTLEPIDRALRAARERGILFFAAAGNAGGNTGRTWPACSLDSGVIAVGATNSFGREAHFSSGTSALLHTFGEAVESCQEDSNKKAIHRSGTSFATPIAVAIAAIVLGIVDSYVSSHPEHLPENFQTDLMPRLNIRAGMERVLRTMCIDQSEDSKEGKVVYITPWYFLKIDERLRVQIIANHLQNVQEPGVLRGGGKLAVH